MKTLIMTLVFTVASVAIAPAAMAHATSARNSREKVQTATVNITENGFEPGSITLKRGVPAKITFLRKTDKTCAKAVVFPDYGINKDLPLNQAVTVEFTPTKSGETSFACGMNMMRGKVIVQ